MQGTWVERREPCPVAVLQIQSIIKSGARRRNLSTNKPPPNRSPTIIHTVSKRSGLPGGQKARRAQNERPRSKAHTAQHPGVQQRVPSSDSPLTLHIRGQMRE